MWFFVMILMDLVIALVVYALWARPWLKRQVFAQPFFAWIEPFERVLFKKSETILVGRLLWVGSGLVTLYDGAAQFIPSLDLSPITTRVADTLHIPQDMRGLAASAFVMGLGWVINKLRAQSTKPLELVAIADKDVTPRVAEAIAMADATKTEAVAVAAAVVEAKAA
jgi:hypothetical protein